MTDTPSAWAMERAESVASAIFDQEFSRTLAPSKGAVVRLALALDAAVADEREACAKVVERCNKVCIAWDDDGDVASFYPRRSKAG